MKIIYAFAFLLASCTHWIAGSEVRIQVVNETSKTIRDFSVVSNSGELAVLVPEAIEGGSNSAVYESEWVGKFNFAIFVGDEMALLGAHRLNSGSVVANIKEEDGRFTVEFR